MQEYIELLAAIANKKQIPYEIKKIKDCGEAQKIGSSFGTLGVYYNGEFKTHELMPEKNFKNFQKN